MPNSNDVKNLIKSYQMSRVSRYGTDTPVEYFDHNKENRMKIIGRITSCDLVMYTLFSNEKRKFTVFYYYTK